MMDVTKQMGDLVYNALIEREIKSGKVKSDVSEIFKEIMEGVVEETMPCQPIISLMDCGGYRADWILEPDYAAVRLIVSAAPGIYPLLLWDDGKEYGVKPATTKALNMYLKALVKMTLG